MKLLAPPSLQRAWALRTRAWCSEQFADRDVEGFAESIEQVDGGIAPLTLEAAHIRAIDSCVSRQPVLRQALADPNSS